jgi:hypothetical protein
MLNVKKNIQTRVFGDSLSFMPAHVPIFYFNAKRIKGASHLSHSNLTMDILNGTDCDLEFEDYLGTPKYSTVMLDPIRVLETQYFGNSFE